MLTAAPAASGLQPIPPPAAVAAPTAVSPRDLPLLPAGTAEPDAVAPAAPAADFTPPATAEGTGGSHFDPERSRVVRFGVVEAESYKSDGYWCRDCGVQIGNALDRGDKYWRSALRFDYSSLYGRTVVGLTSTDATGRTTSQTWNHKDQLLTSTDAAGRVTTTVYDAQDLPTDAYGPAPASCFSGQVPTAACAATVPHTRTNYDEGINGLVAALYDNRHLTGSPKVYQTGLATDGTTARNWGDAAPAAGVPADNFSLRLTGDVVFPEAGNYSLRGGGAGVRQGLRPGDAGGHAGQPGSEGPGRRAAGQAPREEPHHLREQAGQGPPGPDRDQGEEHPPPRRTSPPRTGPSSRGTRGLRTGGARRTATM